VIAVVVRVHDVRHRLVRDATHGRRDVPPDLGCATGIYEHDPLVADNQRQAS
jgi:hypothetical protein